MAEQSFEIPTTETPEKRLESWKEIAAYLSRGATDEHFWSDTYDRELRDAIALESEIAQAIAEKVEVTVTGSGTATANRRAPSFAGGV